MNVATWLVAALATAGVLARPFGWPEAVWAVAGAIVLVVAGLLPWHEALTAIGRGTDVYLFLTGMMLLAEMARAHELFDCVAARAARAARGDARRLFTLVYGVGVVVTVFLSNDATAVVLTPAVLAATKAARAEALPHVLVCAFIANAASFVLPISNPANLVVFGGGAMPPLLDWLGRFALPSILSIVATYAVLRWTQRDALRAKIETDIDVPELPREGRIVAGGLAATAVALLAASAFGSDLGWPTAAMAALTLIVVSGAAKKMPWATMQGVSWLVLALVGGLFVLVAGLEHTGIVRALARVLAAAGASSPTATALAGGGLAAIGTNLTNNLPTGLVAGSAITAAHVTPKIGAAIAVGIDLGPNISVTGSLATILWLVALRRERQSIGAWTFLKHGLLVAPPTLALALLAVAFT